MFFPSQPVGDEDMEGVEEPAAERVDLAGLWAEQGIKSQRIGSWYDDVDDGRRPRLKNRIRWMWRDFTHAFGTFKRTVRNHVKWHKTMKKLHPWAGYDGLFDVMQTHLRDYLLYEEKFGHSVKEYRNNKIATVKETLELLERMSDQDGYWIRRTDEVDSRYPKYGSHVIEYVDGGSSSGGCFVAQGNGWAGIEGGENPREGYFEFVGDKFELAASPDPSKTEKLLEEIMQYAKESHDARKQAEIDSDNDFEKLKQLLKENLYSWWD